MDYDRWDAFLHHLFKQTQGDAWFKPEEMVTSGVAVRVNDSEFRVFPYENIALEPFETALTHLNPVVAVKIRNAAVHAALAEIDPEETSVYVDGNTRIQVLDTMLMLSQADKEQCAAFIRDERVLVVWSDSLYAIIPACQELEQRLIKLLWRSGTSPTPAVSSTLGSPSRSEAGTPRPLKGTTVLSGDSAVGNASALGSQENHSFEHIESSSGVEELEAFAAERRPVQLYAPIYHGLAAGLAVLFMGNNINRLLREWMLDGSPIRFALVALLPLLYCISLFFVMQMFQNLAMAIGPVAQFYSNSKYYSAVKPRPNKLVDNNLPHVTIQMPVYKESLETVLIPSIRSLKRAMRTYARQGGTCSIFINDDGLRLLPIADRNERISFYAEQNIGWVARPPHEDGPNGFKRAGRFKKASNMNYALALSLKAEAHLERLMAENGYEESPPRETRVSIDSRRHFGKEYQKQEISDLSDQSPFTSHTKGHNLEERALGLAIEEVYEASGRKFKPWAANGKAIRLGEIILLVDSDTNIPEDCLRDAAREMYESPTVAIIQHESDILKVAHHYFENAMAYLTRRITRTISMSCANGEIPPFMGHNAFLRWKALQDASFIDAADGQEKIWSDSNVSEDFDMALRLLRNGYDLRWATYSAGDFKEGVSLTVTDECNRWQKYAFGCSELLFNPITQWIRRGPITRQFRQFIWSSAPLYYKLSVIAYASSYYGIAASLTVAVINYVLLGFQLPVDGFYIHNFEVWVASLVVYFGAGSIGYALLEYRLGCKSLAASFLENLMWIPLLFIFFFGLGIPLSQAVLAHLVSYNISWSATAKEVNRSNFFKEIPQIWKRFWVPLSISFVIVIGVAICTTNLVGVEWQVNGSSWGVILPLLSGAICHILFPIALNPWLMVFSY
ncbi:hypothetical protein K435DRAFT_776315 [Dendrothele bispora CBS 962.96]|uniref:Uncharacterized protein n=1 Tax=Dendrothele bispora (strain CBS 962.96) TaxID=1314807 RepID=A0A4S8ME71_DENBC|nr:hypothetical protein K435DRAFT_776315 [Dendrothele bispora CBS 962.96]